MKIENWKLKINYKGFTLIEVLIGSVLVLIVFLGIFTAYQLGLKVVAQSKNKIIATAIASGEIEKIKNLAYNAIGVNGAFPDGRLESSRSEVVDNVNYVIETRVDYVIDEADGVSIPEDQCPNDYKKIQVKVSWEGALSGDIMLVTDIAPDNLAQECSDEGGILRVQVFDAFGVMVSSPLIEVKDPETDATIKPATPSDGIHFFSLPIGAYKVVVSKSGYSSSRTYGVEEIANPEKPHLLVLENKLSESSFEIDQSSSFSIEAVGPESLGYPIISNAAFNLRGEKLIGTDEYENPVYKYSEDKITNEEGRINISGLEWDLYTFTTNFNLISPEQPVGLSPGVSQNVILVLQAENSLLLTIRDSVTLEPVFSAECRVYLSEYDITQYSDENGQTYFIPLESGVYSLEISAAGYNSYSGSLSVSGDTTRIINLERIE